MLNNSVAGCFSQSRLMKFGSPAPAVNPDHPTSEETAANRKKVAAYQEVFDKRFGTVRAMPGVP